MFPVNKLIVGFLRPQLITGVFSFLTTHRVLPFDCIVVILIAHIIEEILGRAMDLSFSAERLYIPQRTPT